MLRNTGMYYLLGTLVKEVLVGCAELPLITRIEIEVNLFDKSQRGPTTSKKRKSSNLKGNRFLTLTSERNIIQIRNK